MLFNVASARSEVRDSASTSRLAIGDHVLPPSLAVNVSGEELADLVSVDGIYAERLPTTQVGFPGALVE